MKANEKCVTVLALSLVLSVLYIFLSTTHSHLQLIEGDNYASYQKDNILYSKSCSKMVEVYDLEEHTTAQFTCVPLKTSPSTPVCLHPLLDDMYISHDLEETGLWEPALLFDFIETLQRDSSLSVIDLGANIGVFSLVAAAMGHHVVAVEPYISNVIRLHAAAQQAGTAHLITLLRNGISDECGNATIRKGGDNQGDTRLERGVKPCIGSCPDTVSFIKMNDLLPFLSTNRAVIKIDIQGYEHYAFLQSLKLLNSLLIPCIYMEWMEMRKHYIPSTHTHDSDLVWNLLQTLQSHKFIPYTLDTEGGQSLNIHEWPDWPDNIVWRRLPSSREQTIILSNHYKVWPN